ncbi:MAG TPA: hypothetical protein VJ001_05070 [Rhodocyclaceae bacterium]|nr:hypothetical protein [Rhodocyclaceae bacterium]
MLSGFDWLRRCYTGAELLATLELLETQPELLLNELEFGAPHSALHGPCCRCWLYSRMPSFHRTTYCQACLEILNKSRTLGDVSRASVVVWGFVDRLPRQIGKRQGRIVGTFTRDENHFLSMLGYHELKPFLQELVMYHGDELRGLLQILPTVGMNMANLLCRVIHHDASFALDRLRIRIYTAPFEAFAPRTRKSIPAFDISDFLGVLEMVAVFRTVLSPAEQKMLRELLATTDPTEEQFYWGRLWGHLGPQAKDMLSAWNIRQWPMERIELLYDLMDYVTYYSYTRDADGSRVATTPHT